MDPPLAETNLVDTAEKHGKIEIMANTATLKRKTQFFSKKSTSKLLFARMLFYVNNSLSAACATPSFLSVRLYTQFSSAS